MFELKLKGSLEELNVNHLTLSLPILQNGQTQSNKLAIWLPQACNFIKKETPAQVFPVNFTKLIRILLYKTLLNDCSLILQEKAAKYLKALKHCHGKSYRN